MKEPKRKRPTCLTSEDMRKFILRTLKQYQKRGHEEIEMETFHEIAAKRYALKSFDDDLLYVELENLKYEGFINWEGLDVYDLDSRTTITLKRLPEDVAYIIWACDGDDHTCEVCRALDSSAWIPNSKNAPSLPPHECDGRFGCRCRKIYIFKDDPSALETVKFIRSKGGFATQQQMDEHKGSSRFIIYPSYT